MELKRDDYVERSPLWWLKVQAEFWYLTTKVLPTGWLWDHSGRWPDYTLAGRLWLLVNANAYGYGERWRMKRNGWT